MKESEAGPPNAGIVYASEQLSLLNERRRRCLGLTDIRKLKVQQFIQLLTCEQDAQQVIEWTQELQEKLHVGDPITKISKHEDISKVQTNSPSFHNPSNFRRCNSMEANCVKYLFSLDAHSDLKFSHKLNYNKI
jgi:hypothetical protein